MIKRSLECTSQTCAKREIDHDGVQCRVQWKYWESTSASIWRIYSNDKKHFRGELTCEVSHRVPITDEVKEYVTKLDSFDVPPRDIWSSLRRTCDDPTPTLGLPSRVQITKTM
ncbi:hypothetical protein PHMEG_00015490 [Phytophthora megakarya]|uniref:Uncharacterized protein n=1 Tax=Phytophthora megakarya TaxID=4795 RepID=A0A225W150_9STRA|nr:hypothetical protein PHMEG_00015490 [Phytophthora megakarya]